MEKKLTPQLKSYKEEFDFLHKKIGELEWENAILAYGKEGLKPSEIMPLKERLDNYRDNMRMLLVKIDEEVNASYPHNSK